jgi:hypothetical protein
MEPFYKYALIVAVIFLILCLIGIGILMQFQNAGTKFPLHPNVCPDRWITPDNGLSCTKPASGQPNAGNATSDITLSAYPNICDKYKWAKENNVNWDGVSNYNKCT